MTKKTKINPTRSILPFALCVAIPAIPVDAQSHRYRTDDGKVRVAVVKMPYTGARNVPELSQNPDYLVAGGIADKLRQWGGGAGPIATVDLVPEEKKDYGAWHRMGLANGHLADIVATNEKSGRLTVGLLGNCTAVIGVLAGLQHA